MFKFIACCITFSLAALLAGCGGSGGSASASNAQKASQGVVSVPETPVAADFIQLAQQESCGDIKNRLYLIDGKEVFWDRAGSCPDNAYVQRLYGANPQTVLCEMTDTLAGPTTFCANESMRALFLMLQRDAEQPGLGLDASHKVELIPFLPKSGTAISYQTIERDIHSGVTARRDVVVRDKPAFEQLWAQHVAVRVPPPPAPLVDFGGKMIVAVFAGDKTVGCGATMDITGVRSQDGKMLVDVEERSIPPNWACPAVLTAPTQMIMLDRNDAPAEFVRHQVQLLDAIPLDGTNLSGVREQRDVVIKDQAAWAALWTEHAGKDRPLPAVDFTTQMVAGVFRGLGGNGCNTTSIESVSTDGKAITVRHIDTVPGAGIVCAMYLPSPAQLVAIPRSDLPVLFARDVRLLTQPSAGSF